MNKEDLNRKLIFFISLSLAFPISSGAQKISPEKMVICRNTNLVRTLRVERNPGDRCEAFYTKAGVDHPIGRALKMDACLDYVNGVRETLEKANWVCKDVKVSSLSTISETVN